MTNMVKAPAAATAQGLRVSVQQDSSNSPEHNGGAGAAQASLINKIKVHIAKGDKAAEKAEQHYVAAGQHLKQLKANHAGTWEEWEALLKSKVGIGKSRASELMLIADGTKTITEIRASGAERKVKERKSLRDVTEKVSPPPVTTTPKPIRAQIQREIEAKDAHIKELETAREHDRDLAEQLQAAKIRITGLESEIAELKQENAELRAQLEAAKAKPVDAPTPTKKRGRPKGSKDKPKSLVVSTTVNVATPGPDLGNDPGPFPEILRRDQVQI